MDVLILSLAGILGLAGMSLLFPLLAVLVTWTQKFTQKLARRLARKKTQKMFPPNDLHTRPMATSASSALVQYQSLPRGKNHAESHGKSQRVTALLKAIQSHKEIHEDEACGGRSTNGNGEVALLSGPREPRLRYPVTSPDTLSSLSTLTSLGALSTLTSFNPLTSLKRPSKVANQDDPTTSSSSSNLSVAILIPAHNEQALLEQTLNSIFVAITTFRDKQNRCGEHPTKVVFRLCVGTDGCTDATTSIARRCGADVLEFPYQQGKWRTLSALAASHSGYDWIFFADVGALWPTDFFETIIPLCRDPHPAQQSTRQLMAIAPTYKNIQGGRIESALWWVERKLKQLENLSGGPISIHGATICYHTEELLFALKALGEQNWLNDDVVLPLMLRRLHPEKTILYLAHSSVFELTRASAASEFGRRRRMVMGNLQWLTQLWLPLWSTNPVAAIVSARRFFRMLWAYWGLCFGLIGVIALSKISSVTALVGLCLLLIGLIGALNTPTLRRLADAAWASILVPYYVTVSFTSSPPSLKFAGWK